MKQSKSTPSKLAKGLYIASLFTMSIGAGGLVYSGTTGMQREVSSLEHRIADIEHHIRLGEVDLLSVHDSLQTQLSVVEQLNDQDHSEYIWGGILAGGYILTTAMVGLRLYELRKKNSS